MAVDRIGDGFALRSKGDIVSHDGSYPVIVPVGSEGKILTAQSSTTSGLLWDTNAAEGAGSDVWAPIGFATNTSSDLAGVSSISITGIPSSYTDLMVYVVASGNSATSGGSLKIRFNGATSDANHAYGNRIAQYTDNAGSTKTLSSESGDGCFLGTITSYYGQAVSRNLQSFAQLYIPEYSSTSYKKVIRGTYGNARDLNNDGLGHSGRRVEFSGLYMSTSAINEIKIFRSADNLDYLSSIHVYGIKRS